jgi:hypothetical protein
MSFESSLVNLPFLWCFCLCFVASYFIFILIVVYSATNVQRDYLWIQSNGLRHIAINSATSIHGVYLLNPGRFIVIISFIEKFEQSRVVMQLVPGCKRILWRNYIQWSGSVSYGMLAKWKTGMAFPHAVPQHVMTCHRDCCCMNTQTHLMQTNLECSSSLLRRAASLIVTLWIFIVISMNQGSQDDIFVIDSEGIIFGSVTLSVVC